VECINRGYSIDHNAVRLQPSHRVLFSKGDNMKKLKKIYSGFFFTQDEEDFHCTWEFNPKKCTLPPQIGEGDAIDLTVVGIYSDDEVECLIINITSDDTPTLAYQKGGKTLLHITTRCAKGVSPVESGRRATLNGYCLYAETERFRVEAIAGYFRS